MNQQMWQAAVTQANVAALSGRGVRVLGPGVGDQACGEVGPGRMLEPADIAARVVGAPHYLATPAASSVDRPLAGRTVLITAGPTREAIDPGAFH